MPDVGFPKPDGWPEQERKQKMEFSKRLAIAVSIQFFVILTLAVLMWLAGDRVMPSEILWASGGPFASVMGFYFVKSGWENSARNSSSNYIPGYNPNNYRRGEY